MKTLSAITLGVALCLSGCSQQSTEEKVAQAREQVNNGDYSTAAVTLKGVVANNPDLAQARALLGQSYLVLGDPALAEKELTNALNKGASLEQVLPYLLQAYKQLRKYPEILDLSEYAEQIEQGLRSELLAYRVFALIADGNKAGAQELYNQESEVLTGLVHTELASAYLELADNNAQTVIDITDRILEKDPGVPEAHFIQGSVYLELEDYSKASKAFTAYLEAYPENATAKLSLASALIRDGQTEEAEKLSDSLLKQFPNQPVAHQVKALARYEQGDVEAASKHIEQAITYGYDEPFNRLLAGASKFRMQNYEQAYSHFLNATARLPKNHSAHRLLALTQTVLGYSEDVSTTYENIEQLTEADFTLLASNAFNLSRSGQRDDAKSMIRLLEKTGTSSAGALTKKGILKLSLDDDEGMADLRQAIEENPNQSNARKALVMAHMVAGDTDDALNELSRYLENEENSEAARLFAASIYAQLGDEQRARQEYQNISKEGTEYLEALVGLSEIAQRNDDTTKAFEYIEKALELNMSYVPALLNMQLLSPQLSMDEMQRANELMERAIEENPENVAIVVSYATRLLEDKKPGKAVDLLSKIDRNSSLPGAFWSVYADALALDNNLPEAIELMHEWLELSPNNGNAYYSLVNAYGLVREFDNASKVAKRAMQKVEPRDGFKLLYSYYELRKNNVDVAMKALGELSPAYAKTPLALGIKGIHAVSEGRIQKALPMLRTFHEYYNYSLSAEVLSFAYRELDQPDEAIRVLQTYLEENSGDQKNRSLLASLLAESNSELAKQQYEELIAINGRNIFALNNLAGLYIAEGDYDKAVSMAERALELQPESAAILDTLGVALMRQGNIQKALYFLEQAYNQGEYNSDVLLNYAEALHQGDKQERARQVLMQLNAEDKQNNTRYEKLVAEVSE